MTTIQQAAANALATYLRSCFEELVSDDVVVRDEWPDPDQDLPNRCVSVLLAGERQDLEAEARVVSVEGAGATRTVTWEVRTVEQSIQLDVWSNYSPVREELLTALDDALTRGPQYTLSDPLGDVLRDGPLLALNPDDGHEGTVDFTFDGPALTDTANRRGRGEYRATINGTAVMVLTKKTSTPVIQIVGLRIRYGEVPADHAYESIDVS